MTIRVLLADDQPLLRAAFAALLNSDPGIEVVAETPDGARPPNWPHSCSRTSC